MSTCETCTRPEAECECCADCLRLLDDHCGECGECDCEAEECLEDPPDSDE